MQLNHNRPLEIAGHASQIIKLTFKGENWQKTSTDTFNPVEVITFVSPKYLKV